MLAKNPMIEELSKGLDEALQAIIRSILALPQQRQKEYLSRVKIALTEMKNSPDGKVTDATTLAQLPDTLEKLLPPNVLVGEVRARLEGFLYQKTGTDGSIGFGLPAGAMSLNAGLQMQSEQVSSGRLVLEVSATYNKSEQQFDWGSFREDTIGDLLKKVETLLAEHKTTNEDEGL